jgi:amino acid transporter
MSFVRSIGRWTLTALMINCIIGAGIFGVPERLMATLGRASPIAMVVAGLCMGVIVACFIEVASQFSEPGGVYLYTRTAFGRFAGLQVSWFWFLSTLAAAAAAANLLIENVGGFVPVVAHGWLRLSVMTVLILIPALANYLGVNRGAFLSNVFTVAKLLPLGLLIVLGMARFSGHAEIVRPSEITGPGWLAWGNALVMLFFIFSGYEDATIPSGEVRNPQRTVPVSLIVATAICTVVYTLIQFVVVATIGTTATKLPLAAAAAELMGSGGRTFFEIAAIVSSYGWLSSSMLNAPRLLYSMADRRELPVVFGKLHPRFNTPHIAIVTFAVLAWFLAVTGTFHWAVVLSAGAAMIFDGVVCAALLRLRRIQPEAITFHLPFGGLFSVLAVAICILLLVVSVSRDGLRQSLLIGVTALIAAANWWWARRRDASATQPGTPSAVELGTAVPPPI